MTRIVLRELMQVAWILPVSSFHHILLSFWILWYHLVYNLLIASAPVSSHSNLILLRALTTLYFELLLIKWLLVWVS